MRSIKAMFAAVAVLTIVGGSLAFKAKKRPIPQKCYYTAIKHAGECSFIGLTRAITAPNAAGVIDAITTAPTTVGGILTCTAFTNTEQGDILFCANALVTIEQ